MSNKNTIQHRRNQRQTAVVIAYVVVVAVILLISSVFLRGVTQAKVASEASPFLIKQVSVGASHACAVAANNQQAYCWGNGANGRLGNGGVTSSSNPVAVAKGAVPAGASIRQVSAGVDSACAAASDNKAYCWGNGANGRLGNGSTASSSIPVAVAQGALPSGVSLQQVGAGSNQACGLASNAKVFCWGDNTNGQLGNGNTTGSTTPVAVAQGAMPAGATIRQLSVYGNTSCVVASDGKAYCWGDNTNGQLGSGNTTGSTTPVAVAQGAMPAGATIRQIAVGGQTVCALASNNRVYCWGNGANGRLGNGDTANSSVPVLVSQGAVPANVTIRQLEVGDAATCAVATDRKNYCWGSGANGRLGNNGTADSSVPVAVSQGNLPTGGLARQVTTGGTSACVVASDNLMYCWGGGSSGQLGNNGTADSMTPVKVTDIAAGVRLDQSVYRLYGASATTVPGAPMAADNTAANLGAIADPFRVRLGVTNQEQLRMDTLAVGGGHACAVSMSGKAYCWGDNQYGQLGNGSTTNASVPVAVDTSGVLANKTIESISAGSEHTCAMTTDGAVYCWGGNDWGQLGRNSTTSSTVPVAVVMTGALSGKNVQQIAAGGFHTCAVASDSLAYCWGGNWDGRLGDGTNTQRNAPTAVNRGTTSGLNGKTVVSIVTGYTQTCAIASDNKAYCWGYNENGQLGHGTTTNRNRPLAVRTDGALNNKLLQSMSAGANHTCAVSFEGLVYCWGDNQWGQLGNNSTANATSPVAVRTDGALSNKQAVDVLGGYSFTCTRTTDLSAACWGNNDNGQLGNGNNNGSLVPVARSGGATILRLATGSSDSQAPCAVATDDEVQCWGGNWYGQLGAGYTGGSEPDPDSIVQGERRDPTVTVNSTSALKLQFATKGTAATCSAVATGWSDVTSSSAISFDQAPPNNGASVGATSNDPSAPTTRGFSYQTIAQNTPFSTANTIYPQQTALWDFALRDRSSRSTTSYCLRLAPASGSSEGVDTYTQYPELRTAQGTLATRFVDANGAELTGTATDSGFAPLQVKTTQQTSTSQLTNATNKQLEIHNSLSNSGWNVSIAATNGPTGRWQSGSGNYAYNDTAANGRLTLNLSTSNVAAVGTTPAGTACSATTGITRGTTDTAYQNGSIDAITLLTGNSSSGFNCSWRLRSIGLTQTVPASQPAGNYSFDLTATVVAQ